MAIRVAVQAGPGSPDATLRKLYEMSQFSFSVPRLLPEDQSLTTESVMMAAIQVSVRQLVLAGGLAIAVAGAPAVAIFTAADAGSPAPIASCTDGEEEDVFTATCTPFLVPNSPEGITTPLGNPDIPEVDGIPCTGRDSGACIGLAEEAEDQGPQPIPRSTISASP